MAKIVEETITITISRLSKTDDELVSLISEELLSTLESVAQELVGAGAVVEVKG